MRSNKWRFILTKNKDKIRRKSTEKFAESTASINFDRFYGSFQFNSILIQCDFSWTFYSFSFGKLRREEKHNGIVNWTTTVAIFSVISLFSFCIDDNDILQIIVTILFSSVLLMSWGRVDRRLCFDRHLSFFSVSFLLMTFSVSFLFFFFFRLVVHPISLYFYSLV